MAYEIRALSPATWAPYAALIAENGGIFGGCWCTAFHPTGTFGDPDKAKAAKKAMVEAGEAHAALVFEDGACLGWAQFGPPAELPRIKSRLEYEKQAGAPPDWRFACLFTGKGHRRQGVMRAAVEGALGLIAKAGGGRVEAYPDATEGRKAPGTFLFCGPLELFEGLGFRRDRQIGKHRWVVRKEVAHA